MPYSDHQILEAKRHLSYFRRRAISRNHERFSFPFLCGSYFVYRKIDVIRIVTISKTVAQEPSFLDVGCGYGEFLSRIRNYLPDAIGMESDPKIFYYLGRDVPPHITIWDPKWGLDRAFDVIFIGWMEPGIDFRDTISRGTRVIVTTLDQGLSLAAEYEAHGFKRIAWWKTPSWEDVNVEIMNKYYTAIADRDLANLSDLRGAHNFWYVYCKDETTAEKIRQNLALTIKQESLDKNETYDYEDVLDECGFGFLQELPCCGIPHEKLWEITFC